MTYNDFPILNSTDYQMLNNKYKEPTSTDRKTTIAKICVLLQECKNSCNAISRHISNICWFLHWTALRNTKNAFRK